MRVTVFAGSSMGSRPEFAAAAAGLGQVAAQAGVGIVYGGSSVGLMGVLAQAAMAAGGEVIGVIPQVLCDAFAALPGGLGTLEELFEILTWRKLGLHGKPAAVLNVAGAWDPLPALLQAQVADGFVPAGFAAQLLCVTGPRELLAVLSAAAAA